MDKQDIAGIVERVDAEIIQISNTGPLGFHYGTGPNGVERLQILLNDIRTALTQLDAGDDAMTTSSPIDKIMAGAEKVQFWHDTSVDEDDPGKIVWAISLDDLRVILERHLSATTQEEEG